MVVVWFIIGLAVLIITHEAGHFFAAKAVGITPETFSIGFGPEIVGWDRGGTRYAIKWFLVGGSVRILGMDPDEEISEEEWPHSYYAKAPWRRAVVIVAGSFVHICIAFLLLWLIFWATGLPIYSNAPKVGEAPKTAPLSSGKNVAGPAYKVGIRKGDVITLVNGVAVHNWDQLTTQLHKNPGKKVTLEVKRGNQVLTFTPTLLNDKGAGKLGIQSSIRMDKVNPLVAIDKAGKAMGSLSVTIVKTLKLLFSVKTLKVLIGTAPRKEAPLVGPVGATRLTVEAVHQGASVLLYWIAYLFFWLGILNLLPLPPLDGSWLLVVIIEKLFHKRIDPRKLAPVAAVVFIILIVLAVRVAMLDIWSPLKNPFK